jgi:Flp pilus assembly protein TadG
MSIRRRTRPPTGRSRGPLAAATAAPREAGRERERGSGTAATVVVMGLLGLLIIGMVQYAADIHGQQAAQAAASIALATAREQNGTAAAGQAAAASELAQLTTALHDPAVNVQRSATEVTVTITGTVTTVLGITQHINVTAAGPVDRFTTNTAAGS